MLNPFSIQRREQAGESTAPQLSTDINPTLTEVRYIGTISTHVLILIFILALSRTQAAQVRLTQILSLQHSTLAGKQSFV